MVREEPGEDISKESIPEVTEAEDINSLKKALAEEKAKAEDYLANWQRAQADFVNYKRRSEQEKEDISKFIITNLLLSLLPIVDDLERAFTSIPKRIAKLSWVDGIRLINSKLQSNMASQGLSQIMAIGEPFDPNLHEAAMYGKGKEGIVIQEIQKGFKLHDRVIRPSIVLVGNGEEEEKREA
jgi:molecular chaperone GrpE